MEEVKNELVVGNINELIGSENAPKLYTNIMDAKTLFNLDNNVENKINDCVGETIRVKEYLVKVFTKTVESEDEETTKTQTKRVTIIIDEDGKSYVTGSQMFAMDFAKLVSTNIFISQGYADIKIIKKNVKNSSNQVLSFELV